MIYVFICMYFYVWTFRCNKYMLLYTFHENVFLTLSDYVVTTSPGVDKITSSARKVTMFYWRKLHVLKTFWGRFCASWDKPKNYFKNGMKLHTDKQVFTGFYVCVYICSKIFFLDKEPCSCQLIMPAFQEGKLFVFMNNFPCNCTRDVQIWSAGVGKKFYFLGPQWKVGKFSVSYWHKSCII